MFLQKITAVLVLIASILIPRAEESHTVGTALQSTTLSGYVDTSASWWIGTQTAPPIIVPGGVVPPVELPVPIMNAQDSFADSPVTTLSDNEFLIYNQGATLEEGEPVYSNNPGGASVWFAWAVPASGRSIVSIDRWTNQFRPPSARVTIPALSEESIFYPWGGISFSESSQTAPPILQLPPVVISGPPVYKPILAVYTGSSVDSLTLIGRGTTIVFEAYAGTTYHIAVEGAFGLFGQTMVYTRQVPSPANDNFANALGVSEANVASFTGNVVSTGREAGEPALGAGFEGGSVWFKWKAAAYGNAGLRMGESGSAMAVFTGNAITNLELVAKSASGNMSFFAEEGVEYSVAIYALAGDEFTAEMAGPIYRVYETTVAELFPGGRDPLFYGLRGATILMYAKTADGWQIKQIEPIINYNAWMTEEPVGALDGKVRITTIDDAMPAPRVELVKTENGLQPTLQGFPGQSCFVSYSKDLVTWSGYQEFRLTQRSTPLQSNQAGEPTFFYRVIQSLPKAQIGVNVTETGSAAVTPPPPAVSPVEEWTAIFKGRW